MKNGIIAAVFFLAILSLSSCVTKKRGITKIQQSITGEWITVDDIESRLSFHEKKAYRIYGMDTSDVYSFTVTEKNGHMQLRLISTTSSSDSLLFEIDNLSKSHLSLFDITYTKRNWVLKRKSRTEM